MTNYRNWLLNEVELWRDQGIIDAEQANQITALYPYKAETNWGKIVFAGIGAIVFGLGVILLFAYNWEAMHRFTKLGVVLASVAIAHGVGFYYSREQSDHQRIGESLHLLGTMLFGAGIWLIAQIYHIDEHYPNAFFVWALGAVAMAWVLPSLGHVFLALLLVFLWHWFETFEFRAINHGAMWLVLLVILPIVMYLRALSALFLTCCLLVFSYSVSYVILQDDGSLISVIFSLSGTLIVGSHIAGKSTFPQSQNIIRFVGVGVFAVLLFIVTFDEFDDAYFDVPLSQITTLTWFYFLTPILLFIASLIYVALGYKIWNLKAATEDNIERTELALVSIAMLLGVLTSFGLFNLHEVVWAFYSVIFLAYSLTLIYRGTRYLRWQSTSLGGVMLAAYIFARFMDLFESLLLRGLAFLVIGALLFAIGFYYSHQKQLAEQKEVKHV